MTIEQAFLTKNPCYTAGRKIQVKGLMLHSVGTPQPNAAVFLKNWNAPNMAVCVHAFIDGNTGRVYQTLPWNHRGWHAGGSANDTHIGIEMCEPDTIRYTSGSTWVELADGSNTAEVAERTYKAAVELFARLCSAFGLDPLEDGVILSHREGGQRGIASGHGDPEHIWEPLGYSMDIFRSDVAAAMEAEEAVPSPSPTPEKVNVTYRVRTEKHGWLPEVLNLTDYAGWEESPITGVAMAVDKGRVQYRVHTVEGKWLAWITENNVNDPMGYAGNGERIDAVQVYYFTPEDIRPYQKAVYRVMGEGRRNYWDWQADTETVNHMDGYAGTTYGIPLVRLQMEIR
ncbi:MAG: N-acetylmuramoyl-L-alanine amidase [Clostridia bacterium]|nr:N-acetylmuramoyl-L-alanine amidase [Clostridia bacterium]